MQEIALQLKIVTKDRFRAVFFLSPLPVDCFDTCVVSVCFLSAVAQNCYLYFPSMLSGLKFDYHNMRHMTNNVRTLGTFNVDHIVHI